jgi:hypothetical protein
MTEPERRKQIVRRKINDVAAKAPDAEAKLFAIAFKGLMLWVFLNKINDVLADWMLLLVFIFTFLAPDMLKKILAAKTGATK